MQGDDRSHGGFEAAKDDALQGPGARLLRSRRRMKMKSEAEIMPTTDTVSASHSGALATPC